jgi:hypothetical protein
MAATTCQQSATATNVLPPLPLIFNVKNGHVPKVRHLKKKSKSVIYWTLPGASSSFANTSNVVISGPGDEQNQCVKEKRGRKFSFFKQRSRSELPLSGKKASKRGSSLGPQISSPLLSLKGRN